MEEINKPNEQKIEIVKGNPRDLDISDVKDNLEFESEANKEKKKENIIIPENQKSSSEN